MTLPSQMTDHILNPSKGWPNQSVLDHVCKISANVLYSMLPGQTGHLNSAGEIEPGCVNKQMALFIFQGKDDFDVSSERNDEWTPISPTGKVMSLVATGGFELETTEFDTGQIYAPNDHLRAPTGLGSTAYAAGSGKLTNQGIIYAANVADPGTNSTAICGVVSRGAYTHKLYKKSVLAFWPIYYPGRSGET
jgi:hypothetical protein